MDAAGGGRRHKGPPRTLDVLQFAAARSSELQALYRALKAQAENKGTQQSSLTTPRHLRRRTASHNRRLPFRYTHKGSARKARVSQSKTGSLEQSHAAPEVEEKSSHTGKLEKTTPSRRVRRRIELQRVSSGSGSSQRDGTRRLATHVWHAKRFKMTKVWGYWLPEGLPGRCFP